MTIYHTHHITPRHMGGTDDPSNLIKLTIEEHVEAHRLLWEEHGNEYDLIAWKCLSGQIGNEEANILATKIANTGKAPWNKGKKIGPLSAEHRQAIKEGMKKGGE